MLPTESMGARQAALSLHALSEADRERVWTRLSASQQARLSPLLDELRQLGVPQGQPWVSARVQSPRAAGGGGVAVDAASQPLATLRAQVASLQPVRVSAALAGQSPDTVSTLLRMQNWPWSEAVIAAWPADTRHVLRQGGDLTRPVPDRLASCLLQVLLVQVATQPASRPGLAGSPAGHPHRARPWYRGLMSLFVGN